jgi:cytochrome c-type biogenesis protein CcmF
LRLHESVNVGPYDFRFNGTTKVTGPNYRATRAEIQISRNGQLVRTMYPEKRIYNVSQNAMTETAIDTGLFRDLYLSLGDPSGEDGGWSMRIHYKPFVDWIWGGAILMAIGGALSISTRRS